MTAVDLTGRTALVTGSTRGIGLAIARTLHAAGAAVAIHGRDLDRARAVAAELGDRTTGVAGDLADPAAIDAAVARVEADLGPIGILVNNAGLTRDNLLIRLSEEEWDTVLDANLKGAFLTMKAVARGMMKRREGRIINISSVVGLVGNKGQANYAASKAGLIGFTKSLAREFAGRGVTANVIAPGFISTDMTGVLDEKIKTAVLEKIPLGDFGQAADIAAAALFLASAEARYITGQVLAVDGGMVM